MTSGGALRRSTSAVPNGSVRITAGGITGTRRMERWSDGAVVAHGDGVGALVAFADESREVLQVASC